MEQHSRWIPHSSPTLNGVDRRHVRAVMQSGFIGHGKIATELEHKFCERIGRRFAFSVLSGFHALSLALRALDLAPKSTVAMPVLTCGSVLEAVLGAGHNPRIVDIDKTRLTLDFDSIGEANDALVLPHAYGAPANVAKAVALGIPWIEDCATTPAALVDGRPAGAWGTFAIFSFGSTKYLTGGGGGMVVTDDAELAYRIEDLLRIDRRDASIWRNGIPAALPGRLPDLNASLVASQLTQLEKFVQCRMAIARVYNFALADCKDVLLPADVPGHTFFRFVCRMAGAAEEFASRLREQGIDARSSVNPWLDELCKDRSIPVGGSMKGAEYWRGHLLSLPIHPTMRDADVERVSSAVAGQLIARN
jgi:perosamine synthetase